MLINRKLKSRRHSSFSINGGAAILVWVNGTCLINCYCTKRTCDAELVTRIQARPTHKTWMILADWNTEFHENPAFAALQDTGPQLCAVRDHDGHPLPTRWEGSRAIDYGIARCSLRIGNFTLRVLGALKLYMAQPLSKLVLVLALTDGQEMKLL